MPIALEITLIAVLAALAIGAVPLLLQLRRTARGAEAFLLTTGKDLAGIAEDVHAARLRMEQIAASLQCSLDEVSTFTRAVGDVGRSVHDLHARLTYTLESASSRFGGILGVISALLALFNCRQPPQATAPENHP
jgi:uncharacterized protein YoxC